MCVVRDVCALYCCIVYITNLNWIQYCLLVTGGDWWWRRPGTNQPQHRHCCLMHRNMLYIFLFFIHSLYSCGAYYTSVRSSLVGLHAADRRATSQLEIDCNRRHRSTHTSQIKSNQKRYRWKIGDASGTAIFTQPSIPSRGNHRWFFIATYSEKHILKNTVMF